MDKLFGTDGIRGTTGTWPLVPDLVLKIGHAVGTRLRRDVGSTQIVVGRDTRDSGPMLQSCLTAGLLASGVDVIDVGIIPTPGVAALTRHFKAHAGVVISASHNPVEQNGIKLFSESGQKLSDETERDIEQLISTLSLEATGDRPRWGRPVVPEDAIEVYARELLSEHPDAFLRGIHVVMDCANGAAFKVGPHVFEHAGATVDTIHCRYDPAQPSNINVECGSEHVRRKPHEIAARIREAGAHFGVAFDGDADRVVFVDEQGSLVDGDHMLAVLAKHLSAHKRLLGDTVVTTNMRNNGLKRYVEQAGLTLFETRVGDKYVIERLMELRGNGTAAGKLGLGGEQAGHLVLLDDEHSTGDGLRTALYFARAFRESGVPSLSSFAAEVGKTPQIIASAKIGDLPRVSEKDLKARAEAARAKHQLERVDLRYSGTEPLFRVMLDSDRYSIGALEAIAVDLCREVQSEAERRPGNIDIVNCTSGGVTIV